MKRPARSVAAGGDSREPMRETLPRQSSPVAAGTSGAVVLSLADAERLRAKCLDLLAFADEIGIASVRISAHRVSALSAFDAFHEGELDVSQTFACWDYEQDHHRVELFTEFPVLGASPSGASESESQTPPEAA